MSHMEVHIDSNHEELHRARLVDIARYKAGVSPTITSVCGKVWAPEFPVDMRHRARCPVCFPTDEKYRFGVVA